MKYRIVPPTSKRELIDRLKELKRRGWIQTREQFNDGLVGNTLEDYLGIDENNLSLPDAGIYEIKSQRMETSSLTTLFHFDPYPRRPKSVVKHVLGPVYGWPHETLDEWSFRITMYGNGYTNRGFKITLDEENDKLWVDFNPDKVDPSLKDWLDEVLKKQHRFFTLPKPYWQLEDLKKKVKKKISNIIYIHAKSRKSNSYEEFRYDEATLYENIDFERFKEGLKTGEVLVDFDARTGHNHGTKFRIRQGTLKNFFEHVERVF